jgi:hypothetical protein
MQQGQGFLGVSGLHGGHGRMRERARGHGGSTGLGGGHCDLAVDAKRLPGLVLGHAQIAEVMPDAGGKAGVPELLRLAQRVA